MKYSESTVGRVFILRMEDGDTLNDTIETFALEKGVSRALAFFIGGVAGGSTVVVGPSMEPSDKIVPLLYSLSAPHESLAVGTVFPNEQGKPVLHMHAASGREGSATVGCTRAGVETWLIGEVVLLELLGSLSHRRIDPSTGFELLEM